MQFLHPTDSGWRLFLAWAADEGWTVPSQELLLFRKHWKECFYALKAAGAIKGFVSAVAHEESGWIGNLLVGRDQRGLGHGAALFDFAQALLLEKGLQRIWLTASEAGRPMYQRRGFVTVDRVDRWHARGRGLVVCSQGPPLAELIDLDRRCWGESRAHLLSRLAENSAICRSGTSLALLQPSGPCWQLGPWLAPGCGSRETASILQEALDKTPAGSELLADVLGAARAEPLLRSAGFSRSGTNMLMCFPRQPTSLRGVMALASLGSIG